MYFELKAFQTRRDDAAGVKTKLQLNVGTPFSADTQAEIGKEKIEPKKLHDLLHFIAHDLVPRLAIKHNQNRFADELAELGKLKEKWPTWEEFFANASPDELRDFELKEKDMLAKAVRILNTLQLPDDVFQINFDELSPGKYTYAAKTPVNVNVPPPRITSTVPLPS